MWICRNFGYRYSCQQVILVGVLLQLKLCFAPADFAQWSLFQIPSLRCKGYQPFHMHYELLDEGGGDYCLLITR
jgi:hypothetical protein